MEKNRQKKLLIVTVNDIETTAFMALRDKGMTFSALDQPSPILSDTNIYNYASYYRYDIVHFQQVGEQGSSASREHIGKGIDAHHPDAVLLIGIGWGNSSPQKIGDVMVSQTIFDANHGAETEHGFVPDDTASFQAGEVLSNGVEHNRTKWNTQNSSKICMGTMISYDIYVANRTLKQKLLNLPNYAVGGEMEGAGVAKACRRRQLHEYIVIKAISDWGDGTEHTDKEQRIINQQFAATNAANFLLFLLANDAFKHLTKSTIFPTDSVDTAKGIHAIPLDMLDRVYAISSPIKNNALRIIDLEEKHENLKVPVDSLLKDFRELKGSKRWQAAQQLFDMVVVISDAKNKYKIDNPSEIFTWLREKITDSKKTIPFIVKGEPTLGKSSVMGLFYTYLLEKYSQGALFYLPFYFNIGATLKGDNIHGVSDAVTRFFDDAEKLCAEKSVSAIFLIDGLTNSTVFDDAVEEYCQNKANQYVSCKGLSNAHKMVYAIDDYSEITKKLTDVGTRDDIDYIIYVNRVNIANAFTKDDREDSFITAYAKMFKYGNKDRIRALTNYRQLKLSYIDFNIVSIVEYQLFSGKVTSITNLYGDFLEEKIPYAGGKQTKLKNQAYGISINEDLQYGNYRHCASKPDFKLVIEQHGLLQYLISKQYVDAVVGEGFDAPILNVLFDKQTSEFVLDLLNNYPNKESLTERLRTLYTKVSSQGRSSLSYLIGRLSGIENPFSLLDAQQKVLEKTKKKFYAREHGHTSRNERDYLEIAQRSICISKIMLDSLPINAVHQATFEYLELLFSDSYQCLINRASHRLYYGDMTRQVFETFRDAIRSGFDFRDSFHHLANKLRHTLEDKGQTRRDPLLEVNLFSMCNLFQTRIETPWAQILKGKYKTEYESTNNSKIRQTFLYDERYQKHWEYLEYLAEVAKWIDSYLMTFVIDTSDKIYADIDDTAYQAFISYLKMMKEVIADFFKNREKENYTGTNCVHDTFDNLHNLFGARRIGWNIPENKPLSTEAFTKILNDSPPIYETISEHILSAYWIGMFFLPEYTSHCGDYDSSNYNKQEILNAILLHDLGEAITGDYSPLCENYREMKKTEDEINSAMFSLGTYNCMGSTFKNYKLWKQWVDDSANNINVKIAKEIDKIQLLYKMLSLRIKNLNEPYFERDRLNDLIEEALKITTPIGQKIFHHLIEEHPQYTQYFRWLDPPGTQKPPKLELKAIMFNPKTTEFIGKGYGKKYDNISEPLFEIIHQNPRSMTVQTIDGCDMLLINLCTSATKVSAMKFVKNVATFHFSVISDYPIIKIGYEDAFSIKSSGDDCYEIDKLDASIDWDGNQDLALPIAYAYSIDSDPPSLNCDRLKELSKDSGCEDREINILMETERAEDVLSFSSTAYLCVVTVQTPSGEQEFKYTFALSKNDDGCLITNEQGYFSEVTEFDILAAEQNRICGKEVRWKTQIDMLKQSRRFKEVASEQNNVILAATSTVDEIVDITPDAPAHIDAAIDHGSVSAHNNSDKLAIRTEKKFAESVVEISNGELLGSGILCTYANKTYIISCCHLFDGIPNKVDIDFTVKIKQKQIEDLSARLRVWQKSSTRGQRGSMQDIAILELIANPESIDNISWVIEDTTSSPGTTISFGYHHAAPHGVKVTDYTAWEQTPSGFLQAKTDSAQHIQRGYSGSPLIDLSNAYCFVGILHGINAPDGRALIIPASDIITQIKLLEETHEAIR